MTWQEIYKLPFHTDGYYIYSGPEDNFSVTALDSGSYSEPSSEEDWQELCDILNGKIENGSYRLVKVEDEFITLERKSDFVLIRFRVRAWGYLTGVLKLSDLEAASIQDDFAKWVGSKFGKVMETEDISAPQWIKVEDRLPQNSEVQSLIVMTDMGKCFEAYYYNDEFYVMDVRNGKCYYDNPEMSDSIIGWFKTPEFK